MSVLVIESFGVARIIVIGLMVAPRWKGLAAGRLGQWRSRRLVIGFCDHSYSLIC